MTCPLIEQWRKELAQDIVSGKEKHELNDAARLLEDEIERRGLQVEYLLVLAGDDGDFLLSLSEVWSLIRATPEQRARAFLKAVGNA